MDRYEWTEKESTYLIEADGSVYEDVEGVGHPQVGQVPGFVVREILRLADERARIRKELIPRFRDCVVDATAQDAVDRLKALLNLVLPKEP